MKHTYFLIIVFFYYFISLPALSAQTASDYLQRAQLLDQQGNHQEAIRNYTFAISLEPANASAYALRGFAKAKIYWYELAIEDYGLALKLNNNDIQSLLNRGIAYIKIGEYAEAIEDFDRVLVVKKDNPLAFFMRAEAKYEAIKDVYATQKPYSYFEIVRDYTQAVNIDRRFALAFHKRGLARMDSLHTSSRILTKAELGSICEDWYFAADLGDQTVADVIREYCGNEMPLKLIEKMAQLARTLQGNNRSLETLSLLNQLIDTRRFELPEVYEALQSRVELRIKSREFVEALKDAEQLVSLNNKADLNRAKALYLKGLCHINLRRFKESLADLDEAILLGYRTSWIYYERGNVQYELKNESQACLDWQESEDRGDKRASDKLKIYCKRGLFRK
jgi:tetratricopeptide (TPR) repeat protein